MTKQLLIALGLLLVACTITSCSSSGLAGTCSRFNMDTDYVIIEALDSETLGASKTVTKFKCVPRKYKVK